MLLLDQATAWTPCCKKADTLKAWLPDIGFDIVERTFFVSERRMCDWLSTAKGNSVLDSMSWMLSMPRFWRWQIAILSTSRSSSSFSLHSFHLFATHLFTVSQVVLLCDLTFKTFQEILCSLITWISAKSDKSVDIERHDLCSFLPLVQCLKELAGSTGVSVTFMAKPDAAQPGSSCHIHLSLWEEGRNIFAGNHNLGSTKCRSKYWHLRIEASMWPFSEC